MVPVANVPPIVAEHLRRLVASQELTLAAALDGDRELLLAAILTDPFAGRVDPTTAARMAEELVTANAPHLPAFTGGTPRMPSP